MHSLQTLCVIDKKVIGPLSLQMAAKCSEEEVPFLIHTKPPYQLTIGLDSVCMIEYYTVLKSQEDEHYMLGQILCSISHV